MKKAILFIFLCTISIFLLADFQRDVSLEKTQPNGMKIKLLGTGDEYYGILRDEKGYTVLNDPSSGYYVYAMKDGSELKPSKYTVGLVDPASIGIEPYLAEDLSLIKEKVKKVRDIRPSNTNIEETRSYWNNLVVYIGFNGTTPFSHDNSHFNDLFNGNIPSVRHFFLNESGNAENVTANFGPFQSNETVAFYYSENPGYYKPYSSSNTSGYANFEEGWSRLCLFLAWVSNNLNTNGIIPNVNYDSNSDGYIDNITFVIQGEPTSQGEILWPQSGYLANEVYVHNKRVGYFNLVFESSNLGTVCHELSHSIGFPNLYRANSYISNYHPAGYWDVMDEHGTNPTQSLVYMKYKYGHWCSLPNANPVDATYSQTYIQSSPFTARRFASNDPNEFYMVEFRKQIGPYESSIPGNGLIVYRIDLDAEDAGNTDGPPDEVYVYRPGGTLSNNGTPSQSFFSGEAGRTEFHQYTDPTPFLSSGSNGGLIMTDISYSSGTFMTFSVKSVLPDYWTGAVSTDWFNAANWLTGVPGVTTDIEIHSGSPRYPVVNSTANCRNLEIKNGGSLIIQAVMIVNGDLTSSGSITINGASSLNVYGDTYWESSPTVTMANDNCRIEVRGDMTFSTFSDIHCTSGRWLFSDPDISTLKIYGNVEINIMEIYKTNPNYLMMEGHSEDVLTVNNGIYVYNGKWLRNNFPGTIEIKGNLSLPTGAKLTCDDGTIKFSCTTSKSISVDYAAGNYLHSLEVNMATTATLSLSTSTRLKNDLTITRGIFNPNNYTLYVEGNWTNTVGETGFVEGTGQVVFSGQQTSSCNSEHFNSIVLYKYETQELIIPPGSHVRTASYDWTEGVLHGTGGEFKVDDLVDTSIIGGIILDSGTIDFMQDAAGLIDLNGNLTIHGGIFYIRGGSTDCRWAYATGATLTMSGGVIDIADKSISIAPSSYSMVFSCTGGTVRTPKNISVTRNNVHIYNMTFEMYGTTDATITYGTSTGSFIANLTINKGARNGTESKVTDSRRFLSAQSYNLPERANKVTVSSPMSIGGLLNIASGTLDINGKVVEAIGGVAISGNLQMTTTGGTLSSYNANFVWNSGSTSNVTMGTLYCEGNWMFNTGSAAHLDAVTVTWNVEDNKSITSASANSWFGNLALSEYYGEEVFFNLADASTTPLLINGTLTLSSHSTLNLGSKSVSVGNNVTVNTGSKIKLGPDAVFLVGSGRTVTFNTGSAFEAIGILDHPAKLTHQADYYTFNMETGTTISAQYATFEYMGTAGINVKSGALVDGTYSFNYCTFQNGAASGTLLTVNNSQIFTAYSTVFPANTWSGSSNVTKSVNLGTVTFSNATGTFAGGTHDNDTYNRILWTTTANELLVNSYSADFTSLYVCSPVTISAVIRNNSANPVTVPIRVDVYYNRTSLPAETEAGDAVGFINSLGAFSNATCTLPALSTDVVGTWHTWFRVDRLHEIFETNETNNGGGSLNITWNILPPIENLSLNYDGFSEQMILTWTYPLTVNHFNIYRSNNPNGPFTNLIGTTTSYGFSEYEPTENVFYQVKAEKTLP
jgi:M6 family metalloprotease-like protein